MSEYFRACIKKDHYGVHPSTIKFRSSLKNTIYEALKRRTWKETEGDDFDFNWSEKNYYSYDAEQPFHVLFPQQHINHFPNNYELTRKDMMYKNLKLYKKQLEKEKKYEETKEYDFFPKTYNMPNEFVMFLGEYKNSSNVWIMKPVGKAQGRGIFLITSINQIQQWKNSLKGGQENLVNELYIAQKYLNNPLLLGGRKFDLRVYALVTSYQPLTVYLYRTAFARFTHVKYSTNPEDLSNNYMHLTNVAVQKCSDQYDKLLGGKWDMRHLKHYLMGKYGEEPVNKLVGNIQRIIMKSFISVQKVIANDNHCFELYGFDILVDSDLNPWLIEINSNPSLTANTSQDSEMKIKLLDDMCTILDLEKVLTGNEDQVGGFDIICRTQPIKLPLTHNYSTRLGAFNNREKQLKALAKNTSNRLANLYLQKKKNLGSTSNTTNSNQSNNISVNLNTINPSGLTISSIASIPNPNPNPSSVSHNNMKISNKSHIENIIQTKGRQITPIKKNNSLG